MAGHGIRYRGALGRYYLRGIARLAIGAALCRLCSSRTVNGIRVLEPSGEKPEHFIEVVTAALALIAERDNIRFRRVRALTGNFFDAECETMLNVWRA